MQSPFVLISPRDRSPVTSRDLHPIQRRRRSKATTIELKKMTISLILIVSILSLLLLPLTCLSILFSLQSQNFLQISSPPSSSVPNTLHSYLTHSHLSSFWKLLLRHSLFPDSPIVKTPPPGVRLYGDDGGDAAEEEECSVCLCRILQGEEVRELRCHHLFHSPCLDSWIGTGRVTCPLCRGGVASPAAVDDGGAEVVFFQQFCSLEDHRQDNWWLR